MSKYITYTPTTAELGISFVGTLKPYDATAWDHDDFIDAWLRCEHLDKWDDFYASMAIECLQKTGSIITPVKLAHKLASVGRAARNAGYNPPNRPDKPSGATTQKKTVKEVAMRKLQRLGQQ